MDDQYYTQNVKKIKCAKCKQTIEYGLPSCPYCGVKYIYPSRFAPTEFVSPPKRDRANGTNLKMHRYDLLPRIALVICAVVLLLSLFLPYLAMTGEMEVVFSMLKAFGCENVFYESVFGFSGSFKDIKHFSLLEYAVFMNGDSVNMDGNGIYVLVFILAVFLAVWILICGVFSSGIYAAVGAVAGNTCFLIVFCVLNWDFKVREIVPDAYRWSVAFYLILISLILIFLLTAWQIFVHSAAWEKYFRRRTRESDDSSAIYRASDPWETKEDSVFFDAQRMYRQFQQRDEDGVIMLKIRKYKKMMDDGLITEEEYQARKRKLLDS